jgi:membrane-bound lytic murein transglycosylase B
MRFIPLRFKQHGIRFAPQASWPKMLQTIILCMVPILVGQTYAQAKPQAATQFDANQLEAFARSTESTWGLPSAQVQALLQQAQYQASVVQAVRPPKSPTVRNWDTYRARFVEPIRTRKGVQFWLRHEAALKQAESLYGVPQAVVVAIIGVETIYGEHTGNFRVLDSLATLGFAYPKGQKDRSEFFQKELGAFMRLCQVAGLDPLEIKGSFAGAIGLGQFMPSSWLNFAVDGDNNGHIDLFHSPTDAIHSVANFLKVHGWQTGKAGRVVAHLQEHADLRTLLEPDILPTFTSSTLETLGVQLAGSTQADEKLALVELVRGENPSTYVVGGQNFYAVTRYNRSAFYANAVLELAEQLQLAKGNRANVQTIQ